MRLSGACEKYLQAPPHSEHMSIEEAETLGRDLARSVTDTGLRPDLVVGLANGAFLPAKTVADTLGLSFHMVKVRRKGSRYKQRLLFIKQRLRLPSGLIMWGPIKALWVIFQNRTSALETASDLLDFEVAGKHVLIVDDCVDTGASLRHVSGMLRAHGAAEIHTAVYCWARMPKIDEAVSRPDFYLHRNTQFYPWSNNSRHLAQFHEWLARHGLALWQ